MDAIELGWELSTAVVFLHEAIADRLGLNAVDHKALGVVVRNGPLPAGVLATRLGMGASAVTGLVDRLERAGYVRRTSDPADRRRVLISPATEATPDLGGILTELGTEIGTFTTKYDEGERAIITDYLINMIAIFRIQARRLTSDTD